MSTLYENYYSNADTAQNMYGSRIFAESFIAESAHTVSSLVLRLYKNGTANPMNVVFTIEGNDATIVDHPNDTAIATQTVDCYGLTTNTAGEDKTITFDTPSVALTVGVKYWITVAVPAGNSSNSVFWRQDSSGSAYAGNERWTTNNRSTWAFPLSPTTADLQFKVYGDAVANIASTCSAIGGCEGTLTLMMLFAEGICSVVSVVYGTAVFIIPIVGTCAVVNSCIGMIIASLPISGVCSSRVRVSVFLHAKIITNDWPDTREADYDPDLTWDEEAGEWITEITGPGRYKQQLVTVGYDDDGNGVVCYG